MRTSDLLARFDALPDLLRLAKHEAENGGDTYAMQVQLLTAWRRAHQNCRTAMPYRHMFRCAVCGHTAPEIGYKIHIFTARKRERRLEIKESDVHAIREHGAEFPDELAAALG